jgi:topoisomerase-4 subunit B
MSDQQYINSLIKSGNDRRTRASVEGITEATSANRKECELYVCEGKSARGNLVKTRNSRTQAILPLRGKPLNVANVGDIKEIIGNREIQALINGIGCGIIPDVHMEDARYGKIIIACDADPDGKNIEALVIGALAFLNPHVLEDVYETNTDTGERTLVRESMVYLLQAPLYKQDSTFIYDEKDLDMKKKFKRFKGLGSMSPEDAEVALVDPKTRRIKRVVLNGNREKILDIVTTSSEKKRIMVSAGLLVE